VQSLLDQSVMLLRTSEHNMLDHPYAHPKYCIYMGLISMGCTEEEVQLIVRFTLIAMLTLQLAQRQEDQSGLILKSEI
jgi:hypothetical protein